MPVINGPGCGGQRLLIICAMVIVSWQMESRARLVDCNEFSLIIHMLRQYYCFGVADGLTESVQYKRETKRNKTL